MGEWWYRQEYECLFVENQDSVFEYGHVDKALDNEVGPLFEELDW